MWKSLFKPKPVEAESSNIEYESIPLSEAGQPASSIHPTSNSRRQSQSSLLNNLWLYRLITMLSVLAALLGWLYVLYNNTPQSSSRLLNGKCEPRRDAKEFRDLPIINAISHNDYNRERPLVDALSLGIISIEVELHLNDDVLLVGHDRHKLSPKNRFKDLYLEPLTEILQRANKHTSKDNRTGIFPSSPDTVVQLILTLRGDGEDVFVELEEALEDLYEEGFLTTYHPSSDKITLGPVIAILSGNQPILEVLKMKHRYLFVDAPLLDLGEPRFVNGYTVSWEPKMSPLASADITHLNENDRINSTLLAIYTKKAHDKGIKVRWPGLPEWPKGERDASWQAQLAAKVDYISGSDLIALAQL